MLRYVFMRLLMGLVDRSGCLFVLIVCLVYLFCLFVVVSVRVCMLCFIVVLFRVCFWC